ncbi:MAG: hypothetical protein E7Y34_02950, partial [Mycoplasma sp.]|nr:hypothetical protein [Mycoplasma sp.]
MKESKPLIETLGIEDVNLYQGLKVNHVFSLIGLIDTTAGLYAMPGQDDNWLTYTKKAIDVISKKANEGFQKTYGVFEDFVNYFLKNTINKVAETFKLYKKIADSRLPLKYTTQYGAYENLYISQIESVTDTETGQFAAKVNLKLEEL